MPARQVINHVWPPRVKQRVGIYLVVISMVLTWPLHIGAASFVLAEWIGNLFAPNQDQFLIWFPTAAAGGVFMIVLAIGMFVHRRLALYGSALVFLGGVWTVNRLLPNPAIDWSLHIHDWAMGVGLIMLFIFSASYLCWLAHSTRPRSNGQK
jgi:hypothetical protein